jgi:hypothetical protein
MTSPPLCKRLSNSPRDVSRPQIVGQITRIGKSRASKTLRAELVKLGKVQEAGVWLGRQGTIAGVGDLIQGRRNAWELKGWWGNPAAPINWATYRVTGLRADGGLSGTDTKIGAHLELPADYVARDVRLAYAATVHSAQGRTVDTAHAVVGPLHMRVRDHRGHGGRTVDTAHAVVGPGMDAAGAYVAMSRGRESNTAWAVTEQQAEGAGPDAAPVTEPRSARAVLADLLETSAPDLSASAEREQLADTHRAVTNHGEQLIQYAEKFTAARVAATLDGLAAIGQLCKRDRLALAADDSSWSLERLLRTAELGAEQYCVMRAVEPVDAMIERLLIARLSQPDVLAVLADATKDIEAQEAATEVARLKAKLVQARAMVDADELTLESLSDLERRTLPRIADAERRARPKYVPSAVLGVAGPDAAARWGALPMTQRRAIVKALVEVRIHRTGRGNQYSFDPSAIEVRRLI